MTLFTKLSPLALLALLGLSSLSGCSGTEQSCTDIGCVDQVSISLAALGTKYAAQLPLTVQVCAGAGTAACVTATVKAGATCDAPMSPLPCSVAADGTVQLAVTPAAADVTSGKVDVHVTVTDAMNAKVFEKTMSTTLTSSTPNGASCPPVCHQGTLAFTP